MTRADRMYSIMPRSDREYSIARPEIRTGDILLFRRRNWITRAIAVAGRSQYVHAAMAGWWGDRLMCVEMTNGGGRAQLLSNVVARWPGTCDVYTYVGARAFRRQKALEAMIEITGTPYGWTNLIRAALLHLPVLRWLIPAPTDDDAKSSLPPFCSYAVSTACRAGGVDPVPNLADQFTEPADLARSAVFDYRFTLR